MEAILHDKAAAVFDTIEEITSVTRDELTSPSRERHHVEARQIFAHICRKCLNLSTPKIGQFINRKHSTVINLLRTFRTDYETDARFSRIANRCTNAAYMKISKVIYN